jgi:hypothetical protein
MKYLKKIFENSKIEALIDAVEEYNKVLKQDYISRIQIEVYIPLFIISYLI